jgi:hypothetical protein
MRRTVEMRGRMGKTGTGRVRKGAILGGYRLGVWGSERLNWDGNLGRFEDRRASEVGRPRQIEVFGPNGTLLVQNWTQNGDDEVSEVRGTFVKLQPANDAMIG